MLHIQLLGHLRVVYDGNPLDFNPLPKTLPLWVYLLLHRTTVTPRNTLAYLLWPDVSDNTARANLRRHLHNLDRALPAALPEQPWILRVADGIQWNPESDIWLDVSEFERLCNQPEYLAKAAAVYNGDLLPHLYDDWLIPERERLRVLYFDVLRQLAASHQSAGDFETAKHYVQEALRRDPLDETFVRQLMSLHYAAGERARALQIYEQFKVLLTEEMQTTPDQATERLFEVIYNEDPLLENPSASPAVRGRNNIPAAMTSFVGRDKDLASLQEMLAGLHSPVRLVTLTGPPGTGKTRLALELGRRLLRWQAGLFPDGIYFIDLSAVTSSLMLIPTLASILEIKEASDSPLKKQVSQALQSQYTLLILDNFEHLLDASIEIRDLLAAAPQLRILVTSRIPLLLYGEYEFAVSPLTLPEPNAVISAADPLEYSAVALFQDRARQCQKDFLLTDANISEIVSVCTELDGLPLAIELAAGHLRDLPLSDVQAQLQAQRLSLSSRLRDVPERHRTLHTAIQWSYDLLNEADKKLLQCLSVFAGGWTLDAALAVCGADSASSMMAGLESLVGKNLIQHSGANTDSERYRMLATIREFASEQFKETDGADSSRLRYTRYFADFAQDRYDRWYGSDKTTLVQQMSVEEDNFHAALSWALIEAPPLEPADLPDIVYSAARISLSLHHYWKLRGRLTEAIDWTQQVLAWANLLPPLLQSELTNSLAVYLQNTGQMTEAAHEHQRALAIAQQIGDYWYASKVLNNLGIVAAKQGELEQAGAYFEDAIRTARTEDPAATADHINSAISNLAVVKSHLGRYDEAESLLNEALGYDRTMQDERQIAARLHNLGMVCIRRHDYRKAKSYLSESLQISHHIGDKPTLCTTLLAFAQERIEIGQFEIGCLLLGSADAARSMLGVEWGELANTAIRQQFAKAREYLGAERVEVLLAEGQALSLEEAVALALRS